MVPAVTTTIVGDHDVAGDELPPSCLDELMINQGGAPCAAFVRIVAGEPPQANHALPVVIDCLLIVGTEREETRK